LKKVICTILSVLLLALIGGIFYHGKISKTDEIGIKQEKTENDIQPAEEVSVAPEENITQSEKESVLPVSNSVLLNVPFLSQAPFAKWDALHEDACEEASSIMVKYFLDGTKTISKEQGEKEIQDLAAFEKKNKYGLSITLNELNEIASKYYNLKAGRVEKDITVEDIKKELSSGKPVIVGAAGKVLPNPNFKNGGPNYHMLVIIGYDEKGFITNDPGTRLGKGFRYSFDDLLKSIHDWNEKNILSGGRNYLVFD